jgi:hypothetical protein
MNYFREIRERITRAFYFPPSFPRLTDHQIDLLIKIARLTKEKGEYLGEFWWRVDPEEPNYVLQIKPRTLEGNLDLDNPLFKGKQLAWIAEHAHMVTLDKFGYIVISEIEECGSNKEKWRHFTLTQLGYDFTKHIHQPYPIRLFRNIWEKTESQLLAFIFGILGALTIEGIKYIFVK